MILVKEAGWRKASGFDACSINPVLPSTTIDEPGGEDSTAVECVVRAPVTDAVISCGGRIAGNGQTRYGGEPNQSMSEST
jgi:hypothetical protein